MVNLAKLKHPGVFVNEVPPLATPIAGAGTSTPGFIGVMPDTVHVLAHAGPGDSADIISKGFKFVDITPPAAASPQFITSWTQFTKLFGGLLGDQNATANTTAGLTADSGQRTLAQAVYGFFNNGGTSCYVTRVAPPTASGATDVDLSAALTSFQALDDISMVAAPGLTTAAEYNALIAHCVGLKDRVAILDAPASDKNVAAGPSASDSAAVYFPWIQVFDPGTQLSAGGSGLIYVPPSGHIAGIWARSDANRGVFKAPANEPVLGAVDLQFRLSDADQDNVNPSGINLIRWRSGAIRVWGARTVGGAANGDYTYLSTRRYFNYLRKSIERGTQWVVFEPNSPSLWKRIIRSIDDFLLNEWQSGALFGDTPKQAYFIKCDHELNDGLIARGVVLTQIGVAIVQPAEFVVFEIQQVTGG
jgi:uncharacterized protein